MTTAWRLVLVAALLALPQSAGEPAPTDPSQVPPFHLPLRLDVQGLRPESVELGVHPGATPAYDRAFDAVRPPPPFAQRWVQAWLEAPATLPGADRLERSFVPPATQVTWVLVIDLHGDAGPARLSWDPAAVRAIGGPTALDLALPGGQLLDMRDEADATLALPEGRTRLTLVAERIFGTTPPPPRDLDAAPGPAPGQVTLSWSPPDSDGGSTLKRYHVYREEAGEWARIGVATGTRWRDADREVGTMPAYRVTAVNRLGEGDASDGASTMGTGKPAAYRPQPGRDERPVLAGERAYDAESPLLPGVREPLLTVRAAPTIEDGNRYRIHVQPHGQPGRNVTVFTATQLPPLDAHLVSVGPLHAPVETTLRWEVALEAEGDAPRALVLRSMLLVAGEAVLVDETRLPLS